MTAMLAADAASHDRDGSFPHAAFQLLHEHELLSLTVPRSAGGGGADLATTTKVVRAVARAEPSTALVLIMQYLFQLGLAHNENWPPRVRQLVQRDAVRNGGLGNALRVEPELGTPARGGLPATVGLRIAEGWSLSGHKIYSTGIPILTWLAVWGRTDEPEPRIGTFLVHRDTPGIEIVESWDHLGMRATGSHEVVFTDVVIPDDHAVDLRSPSEWAKATPSADQMAWMSVLLSALYDAVARAGRDWLASFLNNRVPTNLGAPLSSLPRFQEAIGSIEALLWDSDVLLEDAIGRTDRGEVLSVQHCNLLKYRVTNNAIEAVEQALKLTGNHGLTRHNPLERHYRDVLCSRIHTPQNDAVLTAAGRTRFQAGAKP